MKTYANFLFAALLVAGCGQNQTQDALETIAEPVTAEEESTTVRIIRSWQNPADSLAQVLGGDYAELMEFFDEKGYVSVMKAGEVFLLEEKLPPPYTEGSWFVIIAQEEGSGESERYGQVASIPNILSYLETDRLMTFYDVEFSPRWKALSLFKMGHHARLSMSMSGVLDLVLYPHSTEALAYDFMFAALDTLGGKRYSALVDREGERIRKKLKESGKKLFGEAVALPGAHYPELSEIFGEPLSALELNFREGILWYHAYFRLIEEEYSEEQLLEAKSRFLELLPYLGREKGIPV